MTRRLIFIPVLLMMTIMLVSPALADSKGGNVNKDGKLNINKATVEELAALPDVGEDLAKAIVEHRKENGEFVDMMELLDVEGIDNALLRKLERVIYIEAVADCNC